MSESQAKPTVQGPSEESRGSQECNNKKVENEEISTQNVAALPAPHGTDVPVPEASTATMTGNVDRNTATTAKSDTAKVNTTRSTAFDVRFHYRKDKECMRCHSKNRDCFFPIDFKPTARNAVNKCTACRRARFICAPQGEAGSMGPSNIQLFHPSASAPPTLGNPSAIAEVAHVAAQSQLQVATCSSGKDEVANSKRKEISYSPSKSNSFDYYFVKRRRIVDPALASPLSNLGPDATRAVSTVSSSQADKATLLRLATRLNISFESFNHLSLQQTQNNRVRCEKKATAEGHKLAYEESMRVCDERKKSYEDSLQATEEKRQAYEESERVYEDSEGVCAAAQEWLGARSDSAGENIIEEAICLVSSIERAPSTLRDIVPAIRRLRSVFVDFKRHQSDLPEAHKFKGGRAEFLYDLMDHIQKMIDSEISVESHMPSEAGVKCTST